MRIYDTAYILQYYGKFNNLNAKNKPSTLVSAHQKLTTEQQKFEKAFMLKRLLSSGEGTLILCGSFMNQFVRKSFLNIRHVDFTVFLDVTLKTNDPINPSNIDFTGFAPAGQ